jgi:Undecaprenyl-phosphate galactose phosphotransferase WbaP
MFTLAHVGSHFRGLRENGPFDVEAKPGSHGKQIACALLLLLTDVGAIALALELAILERTQLVPVMGFRRPLVSLPFRHYLDLGWLWPLMLLFLAIEGLYTKRRSMWSEIGHLEKAIGLGFITILAAVTLAGVAPDVSRLTFVLMTLNLFLMLPLVRYWAKRILGGLGLWRKRILILGASHLSRVALHELTSDPFLGYEVVGALDDDPSNLRKNIGTKDESPVFVLGNLSEIAEHVAETQARDILIALPELQDSKLLALVHRVQMHCESIYVVPALCGLPMMNLQVDRFLHARLMMLRLSNNLAKPWNIWLKRGLDLIVGTAISLFAIPLSAMLAALIKIDSEGPALFFQERMGHLGNEFPCFKFRTMYVNSDEILARYLLENTAAAEEWTRYAKLRTYDPRVTRVGRFLRRTSLDELPQLWNVLTGEMSLVGPRPYLPRERARIGDELATISSARPGLTGLWQVSGRNELTFEERVQLETWYLRNWSTWLDLIILVMTFRAVFLPRKWNGKAGPVEQATDEGYATVQPEPTRAFRAGAGQP